MNSYRLQIVTPAGTVFDGDALQLSCRGQRGDLAVMAGHVPFVTSLQPCKCKVYDTDGEVRLAEVSGGILSVTKECTKLLASDFKWV